SAGDGKIRFWNLDTGKESLPALEHPPEIPIVGVRMVRDFAWSRDGTRIISVNIDNKMRIWDFKTRSLVVPPIQNRDGTALWTVHCPCDGKERLVQTNTGCVRAYEIATGSAGREVFPKAAVDTFFTMTLAPDGKVLASGGGDNRVVLTALTKEPLV